jgi:hypothetical protein
VNLKAGVILCALAAAALAGFMGGRSTISNAALPGSGGVTAKAVGAQGIATRALHNVSAHSSVRAPSDARLVRSASACDTDLEDPEEITRRASLEPVLDVR